MPNRAVIISAAPLIAGLVLEVDGWPQRRHQIGVNVGTEPIEDGSEITDHAVRQPDVLRLTGIVGTLSGAQRPRTAWETIQRLADSHTVVEVVTEWASYPEALILSAVADTTGRDLPFQLTLREIIRVAAPIQVPELSAEARRRAAVAAAAEQRRLDLSRSPRDIAINAARNARAIGRPDLANIVGALGRSGAVGFLARRGGVNPNIVTTARGDRYYRTAAERINGGRKVSFIDPDDAALVRSSAGDVYYRRQDPRIAEVTSDLWERHRENLEMRVLGERMQRATQFVDLFSGLLEPEPVRRFGRPGPDPISEQRGDTTAGRGPEVPRGRQNVGGRGRPR